MQIKKYHNKELTDELRKKYRKKELTDELSLKRY
jgi:hypothetical protein